MPCFLLLYLLSLFPCWFSLSPVALVAGPRFEFCRVEYRGRALCIFEPFGEPFVMKSFSFIVSLTFGISTEVSLRSSQVSPSDTPAAILSWLEVTIFCSSPSTTASCSVTASVDKLKTRNSVKKYQLNVDGTVRLMTIFSTYIPKEANHFRFQLFFLMLCYCSHAILDLELHRESQNDNFENSK